MYDEGKEPKVRFEVDVSLSELLKVWDGSKYSDLTSEEVVALAAALKTLRGLPHKHWPPLLVKKLILRAVMATAPYLDYATGRLEAPDGVGRPEDVPAGTFEEWLDHFQREAFRVASRAVEEMAETNWE
jgi:hypothetical protein